MSQFAHFRLEGREKSESYTHPGGGGGGEFDRPRRNQSAHGPKVRKQLTGIDKAVQGRRARESSECPELVEYCADGVILTFHSDPNYQLDLEKFDRAEIKLVGTVTRDDVQIARVFVPDGAISELLKLVDEYAASSVLTYLVDPEDQEELKAFDDPDNGIRYRGPAYPKKVNGQDKFTLKFIVALDEVDAFKKRMQGRGTPFKEAKENQGLIDSIASVRLAIVQDFWQDRDPFPAMSERFWWEVWLLGSRRTAEEDYQRFRKVAAAAGIEKVSEVYVAFPERVVTHAFATAKELSAVDMLALIGDLRRGKELATVYADMESRVQAEYVREVNKLITPADPATAPSVCILDAGVNRPHPLLAHSLADKDQHASIREWGKADHHKEQHGTAMAGLALYGCLTRLMTTSEPENLRHVLESVKIMPPAGQNQPPEYGRRMQDGVMYAVSEAGGRNRALCMAVTYEDYKNGGLPSLWSGAVDDLCFGLRGNPPSLMFLSAGNLRSEILMNEYVYHEWNREQGGGIEDPGQAWNALTVGAFTERVEIQTKSLRNHRVVAPSGDLCPTSRTSLAWPPDTQSGWPIKPDIVMEGGNYAQKDYNPESCEDLSLLTTTMLRGKLLTIMQDTSPATALAARYGAIIWSHHPKFRPETVRGLLVHSAEWTDAMMARFSGTPKAAAFNRLRCYGYGVPNLRNALHSAKNAATMIYEGGLVPYKLEKSGVGTNHMNVHALPWPVRALQELGEEPLTMRVTLSYYIEPSPGSVCAKVNYRYASHGLRFDVLRPTENLDGFKKRISRDFWVGRKERPKNSKETRNWTIGEDSRTLGSIHSDWWTGTATQLAQCGHIIVYPVSGWWRERRALERYNNEARYSLIVTIKTPKRSIDLYTKIENITGVVKTEVMV